MWKNVITAKESEKRDIQAILSIFISTWQMQSSTLCGNICVAVAAATAIAHIRQQQQQQ